MERHWIGLEDVVASSAVLGTDIRPNAFNASGPKLSGQPFKLPADYAKTSYVRSRLQAAVKHFPCAVGNPIDSMCVSCRTMYDIFTNAAIPDGALLGDVASP